MAIDANKRPIIVIKKKGGHGGHHGGAWKVAYADFVTAMMSLFIVLWLMNSTPQVKKAIAGYFKDPKGVAEKTGSDVLGSGPIVSIDKTNAEKLKEEIQKAILKDNDLSKLSKQIEITITPEGLRIELIEDQKGTFFNTGSAQLSKAGVELINTLSAQLKDLPNHLLIEGHTDAQPYPSTTYTNWELSTDRANAARRLLQTDGLRRDQISQVRGYADQLLKVPADPLAASNRRISMLVQWVEAPTTAVGETKEAAAQGEAAKEFAGAKAAAPGKPDPAKPAAGKKSETPSAAAAKSDPKIAAPETASTSATKPESKDAAAKFSVNAKTEPASAEKSTPKPSPAKPAIMDRLKSMIPAVSIDQLKSMIAGKKADPPPAKPGPPTKKND
jgi:chemotaxis protein MotB